MTAPDTRIGIGVDWSESGAGVASRATQELEQLGRSGQNAGASLGDRLGQAFQRIEQREPTMVLRRARFAIEELGASALGAQGPLGRFAVSLTSLVPGGALTLGAVAGIAAIGIEIKKIIDFSGDLEAALTKGSEGFANMAGASARTAFALGQTAAQIDQLTAPGLLERLAGMLNFGAGAGDLGVAMQVGRQTQLATAENVQALQMRQFHQEHQGVLDRATEKADAAAKALDEAAIALGRVELGAHPSAVALDRFNTQAELIRLGFEKLDDTTKTRIAHLIEEAGHLKAANDLEEERLRLFREDQRVRGAELGRFRDELLPVQRAAIAANTPGAFEAAFGPNAPRLGDPSLAHPTLDRGRVTSAKEIGDQMAVRLIGASVAALGSMERGGPAGMLTGAGGVLSTLASKTPSLGVPGAILSGLGGLFSLLHGTPRVTISDIEQRALDKMKEVQQVPQNVSVVAVGAGGNARETRYVLGRSSSLDQVTRLPYG